MYQNNYHQFTCQADTVSYSSLTSSVGLLVHPSGTVYSKEMMLAKRDLVICSSTIGMSAWIVQECGFQVKPLFL